MGMSDNEYRERIAAANTRSNRGKTRAEARGQGDSTDARNVPNGNDAHRAIGGYNRVSAGQSGQRDTTSNGTDTGSSGIDGRINNADRLTANDTRGNHGESRVSESVTPPFSQRIESVPGASDAIRREQQRRLELQQRYQEFGIQDDSKTTDDDIPEPPPAERIPRGGYSKRNAPRVDSVTGRVGGTTTENSSKSAQSKAQPNTGNSILRFPLRIGRNGGQKQTEPPKPLTDDEARKYRDDLIAALREATKLADDFISNTNRKHTAAYIWQELEDREIAQIADALLSLGKRNPSTAKMVRVVVVNYAKWEIGLITGSKFMATLRHYAENEGFYLGFIIPGPQHKHRS